MKFLRFLGVFAVLFGINFGIAHAETYYTFSLNDNGGSGGLVHDNLNTGALSYAEGWGYLDNGGKFTELTSIQTAPTYSNQHFHFGGYKVNGVQVVNMTRQFVTTGDALTSLSQNNSQLRAEWIGNFYTLTINEAGGSGTIVGTCAGIAGCVLGEFYDTCYAVTSVLNTSDLEVGMCVSQIQQTPTKTGYTFGGFYSGQNGTGTQIIGANGNIVESTYKFFSGPATIYAKWNPKIFTVTLNHQSPTNSPAPSTVYLKYATGWYSNSAATTPIYSMTTVPTKTNYDFGGYWTGTNGSGTQVIDSNGNFLTTTTALTAITSNATIYAKWTVATPTVYTVTLNSNGGTGNRTIYYSNGNYYCDTGITQPINSNANIFTTCGFGAPTLTNYEFNGYYSNLSNGTQYIGTDGKLTLAAQGLVINTNTTWYAQYIQTTSTQKCDCGYYIPAGATNCVQCPSGFYCSEGVWTVPVNYDQGISDCAKNCVGATSNAGACSATECYTTCNKECYRPNGNCPTQAANDCGYDTSVTVAGLTYLQSDGSCGTSCDYAITPANSSQNWCPITSCPANYYFVSEDAACKDCEPGYSAPAGSTAATQCTKSCSVPCDASLINCPTNATCTPDLTSNTNAGIVNQTQPANACYDKSTGTQLGALACEFTFLCKDGYEFNMTNDGCVAKTYTITYDCGTTGTGPGTTDTVIYGDTYKVLSAADANCSNAGYNFGGWVLTIDNSGHPAGDEFTWNYTAPNPTFVAQWGTAVEYNITYHYDSTASWGAGNHPSTYTASDLPITIDGVMTRPLSIFVGWCDDAALSQNCALSRTVPAGTTGNLDFYAKWKCEEPYHIGPSTGLCEACPAGEYWNGTECTGCDTTGFPNSTPPFNWSIDQCWRNCENNAPCRIPSSEIIGGISGSCTPQAFRTTNSTQIEFKGNANNSINTCDENNVPYCPYGLNCHAENVDMPRSVPATFHFGTDWTNDALRYIVGLGHWTTGGGIMSNGQIWSAIMGPAQYMSFPTPNDAYTFIIYPTNIAPDASVPGQTFDGYYSARTGGDRHVLSDYVLNTANAQSVVTMDYTIPGDRHLYAHYSPIDYTITYDCGTATGGFAPEPQSGIHYGDTVIPSVNTCEKPGYNFLGWGVSGTSDMKQPNVGFTWNYTESKTFTAQWDDTPSDYIITYKPNYTGATQSDVTQNVTYGQRFTTKPADTFTRPGYIMTAWSEPFTEPGGEYSYNIASNTDLFAQWQMCEPGTQPNAAGTECVPCPEGQYSVNGICQPCPAGTQPNATGTECVPCPTGEYSVNGICEPCDEGTVPNATMNGCEPCPAGTFWDNYVCVPCPNGYTSNPGATSEDQCFSRCEETQHFIHGVCDENVIDCTAPNAVIATRTWNALLRAYESCQIQECEEGYHIASNACVLDERLCDILNGRGTQTWNGTEWGTCDVTQCNPGFEISGNTCTECANRRVNDEIAVSSYASECEIATCMYQGQKYVLENNECRPICEDTEDDTGTKHWDGTKCVRTCNPGYKMW